MDLPEQRRVGRVGLSNDRSAKFPRALKFRGGIRVGLPFCERFRDIVADSLNTTQFLLLCPQDALW